MKLHPLKVPEFWWFQVPPIHFDPKPGDQWVKEFPLWRCCCIKFPISPVGVCLFVEEILNCLIPKYLIYLSSWKPDKKKIHSRELVQSKCLQNLTVRKMSGCGISAATKREYLNTYTYMDPYFWIQWTSNQYRVPRCTKGLVGVDPYPSPSAAGHIWKVVNLVQRCERCGCSVSLEPSWGFRRGQATQEFNGKLALNDSTSRFSVEIYIVLYPVNPVTCRSQSTYVSKCGAKSHILNG